MHPGGEIQITSHTAAARLARYSAGIVFVVVLFLFTAPLGAFFGPRSEVTLQWLVESMPLVVRGTIRPGMCQAVPNSSPQRYQVTLDVSQTIKGNRHEQIAFITPAADGLMEDNKSWLDVLVFLHPAADSTGANANSNALNTWTADASGLFVLTDHTHPIYQLDGSTLASGEALMQATLEATKFAADRGKECGQIPVYISAIRTSLIVPNDARIEEIGRAWMKDPSEQKRIDGVSIISHFNTPRNVELLRGLIASDPSFAIRPDDHWSPYLDQRWWRDYPVRLQAFTMLSYWNQAQSEDIRFLMPLLRYSPVRWWPILTALAVILVIALWRLKRRGVAASATVVMLGLAAMVGSCWWRSGRAPSTLSFARGGADIELVSHGGRLALLRVQDDAPPHGWSIRRLDADEPLRWFGEYLDDREAGRYGPFAWSQGTTTGNSFSYNLLELPYWALFGVLMLWPAFRGMRRFSRKMRSRQRVKANCCAVCGYDLRASSDKCPECGTVRVRWSKTTLLLAGVIGASFTTDARALVIRIVSRSIQMNVGDADLVVRARFKPMRRGDWPREGEPYQLQVIETLKGQRLKTVNLYPWNPDWLAAFKKGGAQTEWLFCLRNTAKPTATPSWFSPPWESGPYALDGHEQSAYDIDGRRISDPKEILELARAAVTKRYALTELYADWFPPGSPLGSIPRGIIDVPVDERLERLAIGWSCDADVVYRAAAARVLRLYKSPENLQRLHRLLSDPGYSVVPAAEWKSDRDERTVRVYPARERALEYLHEWGISASTPTVSAGKPYATPDWARLAAFFVLFVSFATLIRRRGSSSLIGRLVVGASVFLLAMSVMLAWRSRHGCDSLDFAVSGTTYEFTSAAGQLHMLRVDDGALACAPAIRTDPVNSPWFAPQLARPGMRPAVALPPTYTNLISATGQAGRAGFSASWGTAGEDRYPYRLTSIPDWLLCAVFALLPALAVFGILRQNWQKRRRRRRGYCMACGYDLRGSAGRCSECGGRTISTIARREDITASMESSR